MLCGMLHSYCVGSSLLFIVLFAHGEEAQEKPLGL